MKVLLISTNREMLPDPVAPLGAAYVAGALLSRGHEVRLLDLQFAADISVAVKDAVRNFRPRVVGLSIRNIDNVAFPRSVSYLPDVHAVVRTLRVSGVRVIVLGGSGFTIMPRELLDELGVELGVVGEGEETFPELVGRIEKGLPINGLSGLAYRYLGKTRVNPASTVKRLDKSIPPERGLIDNAAYMAEGGSGNIQTKRGCRFKCCYCTYPIVEGTAVRCRDARASAAEMSVAAKRYGIRHFFVVDNVFNYPVAHAKEFCRELIKRGVSSGWSCYMHPAYVDDELVELMANAGCRGVEFGTDSAVDTVLARLGKGFKAKDVESASKACAKAGLRFCHGLLLGSPGETLDSLRRTLEVMDSIGPNAVIAMLGIRVFPGTRLERLAREEGVLPEGPIGLQPTFYFSPGLDMEKASDCLAEYGRDHINFIMPGVNLRMTDKIRRTLRSHGFVGPLWEYLKASMGGRGEPGR